MKILKNEKTKDYHEIEIQYSFLWIKWNVKYRKIDNSIFRFKPPNNYYHLGVMEYLDMAKLFNIRV